MPISDTHLSLDWFCKCHLLFTKLDSYTFNGIVDHWLLPLLSTYCKYYNLIRTYIHTMYRTQLLFSFGESARQNIDPLLTEGGYSGSTRRSVVVCVRVCVCACAWLSVFAHLSLHTEALLSMLLSPASHLTAPFRWKKHQGIQQQKEMLDNAKPISLLDCTCLYSQVFLGEKKKEKKLPLFKFAIYSPPTHTLCALVPLFGYLSALTGTITAGNKLMLIYAVSEHTSQRTGPSRRLIHNVRI